MMHTRRLSILMLIGAISIGVLGVGPVSGCEKSTQAPEQQADAVDQLTERLLIALRQGAREDLLALATPTLAGDLDERDVAVIARTFAWTGQLASLTVVAEQPLSGGVERRYRLAFERGEVELSVSVIGDRLEGFAFDEAVWTTMVERAAAAEAGNLRVASFAFVDLHGKPLTQPTDAAAIHYDLALEGLEAQLREHHVVIAKQVFDAAGKQVYRQNEDDEIRFSQAEPGSSGGKLSGTVKVPGPGSYVLELEIQDVVGSTTLIHRVAFELP